jgi:hypothetical protein
LIWFILIGWGIALTGFIFGWLVRTFFPSNTYDGSVLIMKYPDGKVVYTLELNKDPEGWQYQKSVLLEIVINEEIRE